MSENSRNGTIAKIPNRALKYAEITEISRYNPTFGFEIGWDFTVCQTPAYFMQILGSVFGEEINVFRFVIELDIAERYEKAKSKIIYAKSEIFNFGGIKDPHFPVSYYLISTKIA